MGGVRLEYKHNSAVTFTILPYPSSSPLIFLDTKNSCSLSHFFAKLYDSDEEEEEKEEGKNRLIIVNTVRRGVSKAYRLPPSTGESAEIGYAGRGRVQGPEKVLLHEKRIEGEEKVCFAFCPLFE